MASQYPLLLSSTFNFDEFTLDAGQSRERHGNFSFSATIPAANEISKMAIWAGTCRRRCLALNRSIAYIN